MLGFISPVKAFGGGRNVKSSGKIVQKEIEGNKRKTERRNEGTKDE